VVHHVGGITHFNDKAAAIAQMVRVAKPGARFMIVTSPPNMSASCVNACPSCAATTRASTTRPRSSASRAGSSCPLYAAAR
jgi:ubiquinone/menaquinone biosynthesis C-methylase UbiE